MNDDDNPKISFANKCPLDAFATMPLGVTNLRRIFLLLTRLHYSDSKNYGVMEDQLKDFVWSKDPAKSKLFVGLDYVFDPNKTDQFPGIFVGVGDLDFKQEVIDNREGFTDDRSGEHGVLKGATMLIIRHASLTPDEALALADLSFGYYTGIRSMLMQRMKLKAFTINKLSTPRFFNVDGADKADKKYYADLLMGISYDAAWTTFTQSHRIKKITLGQMLTELES